jgi:hypothetical protein
VNSEELEKSLRSEFEIYLSSYFGDLKSETEAFQQQIEAEIEKQKSYIDEAFRGFAAKFEKTHEFDEAFRSTVAEHLRLARDEGAALSANAFAEAERLQEESAPAAASYDTILEAVEDISSQTSQAAILRALVEHSAKFASRGAFFIVKSEHLVGWKMFPSDDESMDDKVREIHFPVADNTVLGEAIRSQRSVEASGGTYSADDTFMSPLGYGPTDRVYAVPLVARGRAVAVLYADYGEGGMALSREALETLTRVAGMTVELLASAPAVAAPQAAESAPAAPAYESAPSFQPAAEYVPHETETYDQKPVRAEEPQEAEVYEPVPVGAYDDAAIETASGSDYGVSSTPATPMTYDNSAAFDHSSSRTEAFNEQARDTRDAFTDRSSDYGTMDNGAVQFESYSRDNDPAPAPLTPTHEPAKQSYAFERDQPSNDLEYTSPFETPVAEERSRPAESVEETIAVDDYVEIAATGMEEVVTTAPVESSYEMAYAEPVSVVEETLAPPPAAEQPAPAVVAEAGQPRARLSDRPVDLPIEVPDGERRLHNDARRFARLLVSEIKLYNEKKVLEGRSSNDLYDRLREAIDRSREMYDKRVQPPVAAKFDYFHYELVNSLAEGEDARLGSSYPGAAV